MIIYNYITQNKVNGKQYVGMHTANDINDKYIGSGQLILKAIKKYGKQNFQKTILCICESIEKAHENEKIFIEQFKTLDPNGYNLSPTGGLGVIGCHSEAARNKMKGNKNAVGTIPSEETREKIRQSKIGNTWGFKKGHKGMLGRKLSEETKLKMSLSRKGRKWKLSEETKSKLSQLRKGRDVYWLRGVPLAEETKQRIRDTKKDNNYWTGKTHSAETRMKMSQSARNRHLKKVA